MNRIILIMLAMALQTFCYAQETQVKYYNSKYKEVPENKAKYVEVKKKNNDGSVTTQETDLKRGEIIRSETYRGDEPYGIWISESWSPPGGKEFQKLDYNFQLVYSSAPCPETKEPGKPGNYFADNDTIGYKAPRLPGGVDMLQFMAKNVRYPSPAKESGIQGRVVVKFTITKEGNVADVSIIKGTHLVLDKEAARVLRMMKFEVPPTINGQHVELCFTSPMSFKLE